MVCVWRRNSVNHPPILLQCDPVVYSCQIVIASFSDACRFVVNGVDCRWINVRPVRRDLLSQCTRARVNTGSPAACHKDNNAMQLNFCLCIIFLCVNIHHVFGLICAMCNARIGTIFVYFFLLCQYPYSFRVRVFSVSANIPLLCYKAPCALKSSGNCTRTISNL